MKSKHTLKALAKRCRSIKDDFASFTKSLLKNPFQGDEMVQVYVKYVWPLRQRNEVNQAEQE